MRMLTGALKAAVMMGAVGAVPLASAQVASIDDQLAVHRVADCSAIGAATGADRGVRIRSTVLESPMPIGSRTDPNYWTALCEANNWAIQGGGRNGDLNGDVVPATTPVIDPVTFRLTDATHPNAGAPLIDQKDALVMYHAYVNTNTVLAADPTNTVFEGRAKESRAKLLFPTLTGSQVLGNDDEKDEDYLEALGKAWDLKCTTEENFSVSTVPPAVTANFPDGSCVE